VIPFQVDDFAYPKGMPIGHEDEQSIASTMPDDRFCSLDDSTSENGTIFWLWGQDK
jgi:hypothetical protein